MKGKSQFVVISGCSGGGKSTLLSELARRGYPVVEEPASRVVVDEQQNDGQALPWVNVAAFGQRILDMSVADHIASRGLIFFDRGVVDAGVAITARGGRLPTETIALYRYDLVFLVPPWPEIYQVNKDRRHGLEKAVRDYERVRMAYLQAGYDPVELPRETVTARTDFILAKVPLTLLDLEPSPPTRP